MGAVGWCWNEYSCDPAAAKIRGAWLAHYVRKGCSDRKARELAGKKDRTWPPGVSHTQR